MAGPSFSEQTERRRGGGEGLVGSRRWIFGLFGGYLGQRVRRRGDEANLLDQIRPDQGI